MRTTLALDDELLQKAQAYTGLGNKSTLIGEALKALIKRESARRLARLGGTEFPLPVGCTLCFSGSDKSCSGVLI